MATPEISVTEPENDGASPSSSVAVCTPKGDGGNPSILFMGRKRRRRSSCFKCFEGDYLNAISNQSIQKHMRKTNCKEVLFADLVVKMNKRLKMQERILLITEKTIFNIDPGTYKVKRKISIYDLTSVSMSTKEDNFFAIHVGTEYDYLLISANKIEIILTLMMQYEALTELQLPITFSDSFEYRPFSGPTTREVSFIDSAGTASAASDLVAGSLRKHADGVVTNIGPERSKRS